MYLRTQKAAGSLGSFASHSLNSGSWAKAPGDEAWNFSLDHGVTWEPLRDVLAPLGLLEEHPVLLWADPVLGTQPHSHSVGRRGRCSAHVAGDPMWRSRKVMSLL